jgi:hypothetical protein
MPLSTITKVLVNKIPTNQPPQHQLAALEDVANAGAVEGRENRNKGAAVGRGIHQQQDGEDEHKQEVEQGGKESSEGLGEKVAHLAHQFGGLGHKTIGQLPQRRQLKVGRQQED